MEKKAHRLLSAQEHKDEKLKDKNMDAIPAD